MSLSWQDIVAIGIVLAASVYLVRSLRTGAAGRRSPHCAGCDRCPGATRETASPSKSWVTLELPADDAEGPRTRHVAGSSDRTGPRQ